MNNSSKQLRNKITWLGLQQTFTPYAQVFADFEVTDEYYSTGISGEKKIFNNCQFNKLRCHTEAKKLEFNGCSFEELQLDVGSGVNSLIFNNCELKVLHIRLTTGAKMVSLIQFKGADTVIGNMELEGDAEVFNVVFDQVKEITKATLKLNCHSTQFSNVQKADYLVVYGKVEGTLSVSKCSNFNFFVIRDLESDRIELSDLDKLDIQFDSVKSRYINFSRCTEVVMSATYLTASNVGISEGSFKEITLYHQCDFNFRSSVFGDERLPIGKLTFASSKVPKERVFTFEDTTIGELSASLVHNEGLIHLLNARITERLELFRSNLGKFQFTNVEITPDSDVQVLDCNITDVLYNGFRWNKNYQMIEVFDAWATVRYNSPLSFLYSLRESYRQLKANYQKAGNKIEALEFQKREMNIHHRILSGEKFRSWRNFGNYLIVATNKWFSDFGQNIWKPVVWLLLAHGVIFTIMLFNFDLGIHLATSGSAIDWPITGKAVNLFFHTLLPTHSAMVINADGKEISIAGFLDFFSRICSGYFIYYFISASRKYHP